MKASHTQPIVEGEATLLRYVEPDPSTEGRREVLCALGNGRFVTRAALAWSSADEVHYPGTYLAGGYDRAASRVEGRTIVNEDLVNLPNWLPFSLRCNDDAWLRPDSMTVLADSQELDLDRGVLHRTLRCRTESHRVVSIHEERFVHMGDPHLAAQRFTIELESDPTPDSPPTTLQVRSGIDGNVTNGGVDRYGELNGRHHEVSDTGGADQRVWLTTRTISSQFDVAVGARIVVQDLDVAKTWNEISPDAAFVHHRGLVEPYRPVVVEKIVSLHTSHDRPGYEPLVDMQESLDAAPRFDELVASHVVAWRSLWERSTVDLCTGDEWADTVLALHQFHMHASYSGHTANIDAGIPARGWHGEAYRGHIFWDELFVLPIFNHQFPERSRAALRYRHRRLPEARRAAARAGLRGALFPWQSGSTGREESQEWHLNPRSGRWNPDPTHRQRHIGLAIAYNVWHYWQVTGDDEFLHDVGTDLLFDIAECFSSLATFDDRRKRYVINGVIGPDEYHTGYPDADEAGLDNNAYTNVFTAWLLARCLEIHRRLPRQRRKEFERSHGIDEARLIRWDDVSRRLFVPFLEDGIIEQFEGYGDLAEFDWDGYRQSYGNISRLDRILEAEGDTPNRYKAAKQADTVMLFYLFTADQLTAVFDRLGYPFEPDDIPANVDYYGQRTSHGSTLSRVVHAWVQARTDRSASWECYRTALTSDIEDIQGGTTPEGIHLGAMAGTVDLAQRCYSGLTIENGVVVLNPRLPDEVDHLAFSIRFRSHWTIRVWITHLAADVEVETSVSEPVTIALKNATVKLRGGQRHRFDLVALKDEQHRQ